MSYPNSQNYDNGPCPSSHPVHMISIFYEIHYDTALFKDQWNGTQHPFVFSNGDATGYGLHGDFLNGWDVAVLQNAVDTCNASSGSVEECLAVSQFSVAESQQCQIPATVKEETGGVLQKLPGCNTVTRGPDRAPAPPCTDDAIFGANSPNFVDLTLSKHWAYAGCGRDDIGDRAFRNGSTGSDDMTVKSCVDFCVEKGMPYAGLEFGRECFCAERLDPRYAPRDGIMGSCNYKCAGDTAQTCGGYAAMSIYHNCEGEAECKNWDINTVSAQAASLARKHARQLSM